MSDEVKAAAERVRRYFDAQDSNDEGARFSSFEVARYYDDLRKLARSYLSEHPADDCEPITEDWLRSVGFTKAPNAAYLWTENRIGVCIAVRLGVMEWEIGVVDDEESEVLKLPAVSYPKTRGDVRRLAAALGITLKDQNTSGPAG